MKKSIIAAAWFACSFSFLAADAALADDSFVLATGRRDPRIYAIDLKAALRPQNNNTPNAITPVHYSLRTQNYRFKKGHRIMVQVQSTWFPIIDRNPQTFVPSIFEAKTSDFKPATIRVYRSTRYPSHVTLPVVTPLLP